MKTIRRWYTNIKWLLNCPPTSLIERKIRPCDYCGEEGNFEFGKVAFCFDCLKKALDKALK